MIFLFDANVPKRVQTSVNKIFTKHKFFATWDPPFNPSMDDLSCFTPHTRRVSKHSLPSIQCK